MVEAITSYRLCGIPSGSYLAGLAAIQLAHGRGSELLLSNNSLSHGLSCTAGRFCKLSRNRNVGNYGANENKKTTETRASCDRFSRNLSVW